MDNLGSFPILQFFGGLMVLFVGSMAYVYGKKSTPTSSVPSDISPVQYSMQGPIGLALDRLGEITRYLRQIEEGQRETARELEKSNRSGESRRDAVIHNGKMLEEISRQLSDVLHMKRDRP